MQEWFICTDTGRSDTIKIVNVRKLFVQFENHLQAIDPAKVCYNIVESRFEYIKIRHIAPVVLCQMLCTMKSKRRSLVDFRLDIELLQLLEMRVWLVKHINNCNIATHLGNSKSQSQTYASRTTSDDNRSTL